MEIFKSLIGNDEIKNTLGSAIKNSEFSHAYIIEGAQGTGKHLIARLFASAIVCQGQGDLPCGACNFCHKIENDICADVRFFDAFKVDDIRAIKRTLYETPVECPYKFYIFNDAHKMNEKAQNALLISLEEPPRNVVFLLLCTDASALLETIRSRAQLLRTKPLSDDVIFDYVKNNTSCMLSDDELKEIIVSSSGSLGYVLSMLDDKKCQELLKSRKMVQDFVALLLKNDADAYSKMTSLFAMQRDAVKELLQNVLLALRDMAVIKKDKGARLCFYSSRESIISLVQGINLKKILNICDAVSKGIDALNSNANVPSTLISILIASK
ncbi:MAG: DNA polymerase III subunit [Clostridia bacterium]|nr:DNA polymerase III subunit [Clostridia bacterium]